MNERLSALIGSGRRVVDLGCGAGQMLKELSDRFDKRVGLDVSTRRLELAGGLDDDWEFREADLNDRFPIDDAWADVVVANQVIEHIVDPVKFTGEIFRVLRAGGRCIITTPNIRYIKNLCSLLWSGYGPRTSDENTIDGSWDDGHLHYFTHRDLRELFARIGFCEVASAALIDVDKGGLLRRVLDRYATHAFIREMLSGCILLWAEK